MRINYSITQTIWGLPIKVAHGYPYYMILRMSGNVEVMHGDDCLHSVYKSVKAATRVASRLNKIWLVTEKMKGNNHV